MGFISEHDFPNFEIIPHGFDSWFYETDEIMEISPLEGFSEHDWTQQLPYSSKQLCFNEFPDIENFNFDFSLPPLGEYLEDQKPLNIAVPERGHCNRERGFGDDLVAIEKGFASCVKKEVENHARPLPLPLPSSSRKNKRSSALEFDEIKNHFNVPITEAAKQMNVGLTLLKRRCRELNIMRWPHRKLKSLQLLIDNVKELGLANEVAMLEKHKMTLERLPGLELSEETKKLRQACFKANYKRRRCLALQA
ncbi:RKD4 protein [Spatholobus suberectus]|nr:RKD4 protein [Spatholobus suberectus]